MKYSFAFTLEGLPKGMNGSHGHWTTAAGIRKKWRNSSFRHAYMHRPLTPLKLCRITCTRHSSSEPDYDNLTASFKPIIDGLKDAKVIEDDKSSCVIERMYKWEKTKPGNGYVSIFVEEL